MKSALQSVNAVVANHLRTIEMIGVLMRIFSFSLVSWLGRDSPFLFVWAFNTIDAVMLSWCALIRKDRAYSILNLFWIGVGIVGMIRASTHESPPEKQRPAVVVPANSMRETRLPGATGKTTDKRGNWIGVGRTD